MHARIFTRRIRKVLGSVGIGLMIIGTIGMSWFGYRYVAGLLDERRSEQQFAEQMAKAHQKPPALVSPAKVESAPAKPARNTSAPVPAEHSPLIGKIEIPRVNVAAVVREGVDAGTLDRAVGHVPGTAMPGEDGNLALAAHRDRYFRGLRNIRLGDQIRVETTEGVYEYVVDSTRIVPPTEVSVLNPTPEPSITLITCYPFTFIGPAPERFIVRGRRVDAQSNAKPSGTETVHVQQQRDSSGM